MKIDKKYLKRYYHKAAVDQLRDQYIKKGYVVTVEEKIGQYRIDMVARKEDSIIFFEVKTGDVRSEAKARIKEVSTFLRKEYPGSRFLLVAVRYPDEDTIIIDNIENIMFDYLISNGIPSDLDELSTHTTIDEIENIAISSIELSDDAIVIECEGSIRVQLDYDYHEPDAAFYMSFPFEMKGELEYNNGNLSMVDILEFTADTSEFYE